MASNPTSGHDACTRQICRSACSAFCAVCPMGGLARFGHYALHRVMPTGCLDDGSTDATSGADVRVTGLTTNLPVADIDAARGFYTDYLGLNVEEMNLGWVARYRLPGERASSS